MTWSKWKPRMQHSQLGFSEAAICPRGQRWFLQHLNDIVSKSEAMNLTRRYSQPTLVITVELFIISKPTSTNLARNWPPHTQDGLYARTHCSVKNQEMRARFFRSSQSNGIHPYSNIMWPYTTCMSCVLIPAILKLQLNRPVFFSELSMVLEVNFMLNS